MEKKYDRQEIVDMFKNRYMSTTQIGAIYNCSPRTIRRILVEEGISNPSMGKTWTDTEKEIVKSLYESGKKLSEIADALKVSCAQVTLLVRANNWSRNRAIPKIISAMNKEGKTLLEISLATGWTEENIAHWIDAKRKEKKTKTVYVRPQQDQHGLITQICPICSRPMAKFAWSNWAYKQNYKGRNYYFCSWSHLRQFQRDHAGKKDKLCV